MSVGFVMLCHTALYRAAEVARHWASQGCPVVIHVDSRVKPADHDAFARSLADLPNVRFSPRHPCEWGTWGIVAATQSAAEMMLRSFPEVRHVFLASGSCLPLRPLAELVAYLDARPQTDFIESVATADVGWATGGLDIERFTLRFPFSWRRRRRLFDAYVRLQKRIGFSRRLPAGIVPHLGSQWWCLTRRTLSAILEAPDRAKIDRYFRRVWIPDESYFQTLARRVSTQIEGRSLTLSKFDHQGKPHIFYDDHLQLLRRSDCFVARKIWPRADALYRAFLTEGGRAGMAAPNPGKIDRLFAKAVARRTEGRQGLYMHSRYPAKHLEIARTATPYAVFSGFGELFADFDGWLALHTGARVHGRLFAPDRAHFAGGETMFNGGLSDHATLRDWNPESFLTSLIWNTRGETQCLQFGPADNQALNAFMAGDRNARIFAITGAWAIPLSQANLNFGEIRKEAARLQKIETAFLDVLQAGHAKARVRTWTLAAFIENPMEYLQDIVDELSPRSPRGLAEAPRLVDLTGFGQFLQNLRNQGMQPVLTGDFPVDGDLPQARRRRTKPYLVK